VFSIDVASASSTGNKSLHPNVQQFLLNSNNNSNAALTQKDEASRLSKELESSLLNASQPKIDAVVCVAGGWASGNAADKEFIDSYEQMYRMNVQSATTSAFLAARLLKKGGLVVFTGSVAALSPTPGMIGYGMAKAATHHLVASLASPGSGLPEGATVAAILPGTLDTESNRAAMPNADRDGWTPLEDASNAIVDWIDGVARPPNGALVRLETKKRVTSFVITPSPFK